MYTVIDNAGCAIVTVRRTVGEGAVTVRYATVDGSATAGVDYKQTKGQLAFAPGELKSTISVPIINNDKAEGQNKFTVALDPGSVNPSGCTCVIGKHASAQVRIIDDEGPASRIGQIFFAETEYAVSEVS